MSETLRHWRVHRRGMVGEMLARGRPMHRPGVVGEIPSGGVGVLGCARHRGSEARAGLRGRRSRMGGRRGALAMEFIGPSHRHGRRPAVIGVEAQPRLPARHLLMLDLLRRRGPRMRPRSDLSLGGLHGRPPGAAVEAYVVRGGWNGLVVCVGDLHAGEIVDGRVVEELIVPPIAALIPHAGIAEAIINSAVKPDGRPPIAGIEVIDAVVPCPIGRRPQEVGGGRRGPVPRNPVVFLALPRPIAGNPDISRPWNWRLDINRQRRRRDPCGDRGHDLRLGGCDDGTDRRGAQHERGCRCADEKTDGLPHDENPLWPARPSIQATASSLPERQRTRLRRGSAPDPPDCALHGSCARLPAPLNLGREKSAPKDKSG